MTDKKLIACLFVALTVRLAFVFFGFPYLQSRWNLREDGDNYGAIARTIHEGNYTDVTRGPVYPLCVAVAGAPLTVKVAQAVLDTLTGALIFWLAGRNLWAAWLWALYPFAIWRVAFINKETVLVFLLVSFVCFQTLAWDKGRVWQWLSAGVLLGLVNLCKPTFLLWPLVLLLMVERGRQFTRFCKYFVVAMVLVIAPWTWRNWRVTGGEFLPVATEQGGKTTFIGNYQPTDGLWEGEGKGRWLVAVDEIQQRHAGASEVELDRAFYRAAWAQVKADPIAAVKLAAKKCERFWFLSAAQREQVSAAAIQGIFLALGALGLWRMWPLTRERRLLLALIAYVMIVHALSYADMRFSLIVMPFVCVFAAAVGGGEI